MCRMLDDRYEPMELFLVACSSCNDEYVGGIGDRDDPVLDVTFDPDDATFICSACYFGGHPPVDFFPVKYKRISNN